VKDMHHERLADTTDSKVRYAKHIVTVVIACAAISALLASPALKRAELCNLMSLKQLVLGSTEQRMELLGVSGCKMLTSLRLLSPALQALFARNCYRLQACQHAILLILCANVCHDACMS
jgi:hypothetical protein